MGGTLLFDDSIEIHDPGGHASTASYWFETLADGASFGDPQPVDVVVSSLIRYGAIVTTTGDENREPSFLIRVNGADSGSVHEGIQALHAATRKATTLVWTPPDEMTEPLAWDVQTSALYEASGFDDLALVQRNQQVFRLAIKALPYRRSLVLTVDDAGTPPISGGTLLHDFETTTGWSYWGASGGSTVYSADSTVHSEGSASVRASAPFWDVTAASNYDRVTGLSMSTGTGGYMAVTIRTDGDGTGSFGFVTGVRRLWMTVSGVGEVEVTQFASTIRDENGFVSWVWQVDDGLTVTGLRFQVTQYGVFYSIPYVRYDSVWLLPSATTDHQIVKQLVVDGSAPTPASLRVAASSEVTPLGSVLAVTVPSGEVPSGFQPDGRRWVVQGTATSDATSLHGAYYTPSTSSYDATAGKPIFDVPATMLTPDSYAMVALVKAEGTSTTFGVQAQSRIGSMNVGAARSTEQTVNTPTLGWQFIGIGSLSLPPTPLPGASDDAKVRLVFKGAKFADVYFIPMWEVDGYPVADFSIANCGTGTVQPGGASSSWWSDSPSLENKGRGDYRRGPTPDGLNAQSAWADMALPGVHFFKPGSMTAFVVSTLAPGPTVQLSYYARYL